MSTAPVRPFECGLAAMVDLPAGAAYDGRSLLSKMSKAMKRRFLFWGLLLTVGGGLLFQYGMRHLYPEALRYTQAGNLRQFWDGLTVAQKLLITGMEIPLFAGVVLLLLGLVLLIARK